MVAHDIVGMNLVKKGLILNVVDGVADGIAGATLPVEVDGSAKHLVLALGYQIMNVFDIKFGEGCLYLMLFIYIWAGKSQSVSVGL